jgi:hypothetical protein
MVNRFGIAHSSSELFVFRRSSFAIDKLQPTSTQFKVRSTAFCHPR